MERPIKFKPAHMPAWMHDMTDALLLFTNIIYTCMHGDIQHAGLQFNIYLSAGAHQSIVIYIVFMSKMKCWQVATYMHACQVVRGGWTHSKLWGTLN